MNELDESLERVDQHIVLAFKHVEEQRNRVLELRGRGEDDTFSQKLLATLIYSLMIYEQRRKDLLEFAAAKAQRNRFGERSGEAEH